MRSSKILATPIELVASFHTKFTIMSTVNKVASEDELGQKWDRCIADALLKTSVGAGVGIAFSLLLFKRRPWPVAIGGGFGLGFATSNCQHDFKRVKSLYLRPAKEVAVQKAAQHTDDSPKQSQSTDPQSKQ